tara:strand:+ start:932 stop:1951 length:1020 start_codon:yes stop_codon:yes gene_type:complete
VITKSYEIQNTKNNFLKHKLFLLYGENNGLKKDIREIIKTSVKKKDNDLEILSLFEKEVIDNKENFYNSIYSGSLFNSSKIITINAATDKIIGLIQDITDKYPENTIIILFSDILEKKSKLRNFFEKDTRAMCVPCYLDNNRDLELITRTLLKKNNITLSNESISLLIEKSNSDRDNLKNEIEKITSYALNKKKIEVDEIKSIINFSGEYKSELLINECLSGNILQYKKIFSEIYINTINQIYLLRILSNKVQRLLNFKNEEKNYNNIDNLLNSAKPPIFWKEKPIVKKQLSVWKLNDLQKTISEINDIESLCKKNPQVSKVIFFDFFSKICKKANSYS